MSVYTTVTENQLQQFLENYSLGQLKSFEGIAAGIENTNYFVTTTEGEFVLTLFEVLTKEELPFYVELMAFLNEHEIPSAHPIADNQQEYLRELNSKPAIIMQRLSGKSVDTPTVHHCSEIGGALAELHRQGLSFRKYQANSRGERWRYDTGKQLLTKLPVNDAEFLENELKEHANHDYQSLPGGVIHADMFRDNVLFDDGKLTGILDFYNACNDSWLYDLAITVNDWCIAAQGELDFERAYALCHSYRQVRKPAQVELELWPLMTRIAALRFWLSRLWSQTYPQEGELTFQKDPVEFKNILIARAKEAKHLQQLW